MNLGAEGIKKLVADYTELRKRERRTVPRVSVMDSGRCGAYARSTGRSCQAKALANGRCKNHGGLSTGPKTPEGKRRCVEGRWSHQRKRNPQRCDGAEGTSK